MEIILFFRKGEHGREVETCDVVSPNLLKRIFLKNVLLVCEAEHGRKLGGVFQFESIC